MPDPEIAECRLGFRHLFGIRRRRSQLPPARDYGGAAIGQSWNRQAGGCGGTGGQDESAALERDDLVRRGETKPSGGRPEQLYLLSDRGAEMFPRRYSWFSELLIEAMAADIGREAVGAKLDQLGRAVGRQLLASRASLPDRAARVVAMAEIMKELGYAAAVASPPADDTIAANNCVFHHLAAKFPEVCRFDLGLIGAFTDANVDHQECMVRGGRMCRFKLTPAPRPPGGRN